MAIGFMSTIIRKLFVFKITRKKNNHFIKVKLKGRNKFGVGSVVELFCEIMAGINPFQRFSVFYRLCDDIWNWN
jgi:ubiquinone biosynthesis protein COQ9